MMPAMKRRDHLAEFERSQQNVNPASTLRNSVKADSFLLRGNASVTTVQRAGGLIVGVFCMVAGADGIALAIHLRMLYFEVIGVLAALFGIRVTVNALTAPKARKRYHFPAE